MSYIMQMAYPGSNTRRVPDGCGGSVTVLTARGIELLERDSGCLRSNIPAPPDLSIPNFPGAKDTLDDLPEGHSVKVLAWHVTPQKRGTLLPVVLENRQGELTLRIKDRKYFVERTLLLPRFNGDSMVETPSLRAFALHFNQKTSEQDRFYRVAVLDAEPPFTFDFRIDATQSRRLPSDQGLTQHLVEHAATGRGITAEEVKQSLMAIGAQAKSPLTKRRQTSLTSAASNLKFSSKRAMNLALKLGRGRSPSELGIEFGAA